MAGSGVDFQGDCFGSKGAVSRIFPKEGHGIDVSCSVVDLRTLSYSVFRSRVLPGSNVL